MDSRTRIGWEVKRQRIENCGRHDQLRPEGGRHIEDDEETNLK